MKKIVLTLAAAVAATAMAPEASALPAFASQTGMACAACHFQSYPALTGFGKAFKTGGYTMMGAQDKVEGEHGLSLPATLNAGVYLQSRYIKTNGAAGGTNTGRLDVPDEFALFLAGRVSENIGAYTEVALGLGAGTNPSAAGFQGLKTPFVFDVADGKLMVVPFTVNGLGAGFGYDTFATGSNAAGRVTENGGGYSAAMKLGTNAAASGVTVGYAADLFHVTYTPYAAGFNVSNGGAATATSLGGTYIRAALTPTVGAWDLGVGIQNWSGNASRGVQVAGVGVAATDDKATVIDFQGQGEVAGMPLGVYGSYGWAPAAAVAGPLNSFNAGTLRASHFGILGDLWVMPGTLGVQLGMTRSNSGFADAAGGNMTDNSYTLGLRYKLRQNVKLGLAYTKSSGSVYDAANAAAAALYAGQNALRGAGTGNSLTTFILSMGW